MTNKCQVRNLGGRVIIHECVATTAADERDCEYYMPGRKINGLSCANHEGFVCAHMSAREDAALTQKLEEL